MVTREDGLESEGGDVMKQSEEKQMIEWVDQLELEQEQVGRVECGLNEIVGQVNNSAQAAEDTQATAASVKRIKAMTFAKLGLPLAEHQNQTITVTGEISSQPHHYAKSNISNNKWKLAWAAAVLAVILISSIAILSPEVRAQVRKFIQFLPGFAAVQQEGENPIRYVLPASVVKMSGDSRLEIRGIQIGDQISQIAVTGRRLTILDQIEMVNQDGERYLFKRSWSSSASDWTAGYWHKGPIRVTDQMQLIIAEISEELPIRLKKAPQAERIEDFGSTDVQNGISLTAITSLTADNKIKVTLIPQLPAHSRLLGFGLSSYEFMERPRLTIEGKEVPIERDAVFPDKSEFLYEPVGQVNSSYHLIIPSISVTRTLDNPLKIRVPIPFEGTMELNESFHLLGYPIEIVKVERITHNQQGQPADHIRVYFDVHYNASAAQSLLLFSLDMMKSNSSGYGTKFDEQTMAIEYMELPIQKEQKQTYDLYINNAQLLNRGPWELRWNEE
jgi:hypothetical protein